MAMLFVPGVCKITSSYDALVIQWVIKLYDHTCNNTLARTRNATDNVPVSTMCFPVEIMFFLKAKKKQNILKCHMINRILLSWSFQMKFMKVAESSFHEVHMK